MQYIIVLSACVVAALAAPQKMGIQVEGQAGARGGLIEAALSAGISQDFIDKAMQVFRDQNTSIAQKKQQMEALIQQQPAEKQAVIKVLCQKMQAMKASMEADMKQEISKLPVEEQKTAQEILAIVCNEDLTPKQMMEQVKEKYDAASEQVKEKLKALGEKMRNSMPKFGAEAKGSAAAATA